MELKTVLEIVKIAQVTQERKIRVSSPGDVAKFLQQEIGDMANEAMMIVCFDIKMQVVAIHKATTGLINASLVDPREIFKAAILNNAASIIMAHSHPSYILDPSNEDIKVTEKMVEAGNILGIEILDHLIVSPSDFYSIREHHKYLFL